MDIPYLKKLIANAEEHYVNGKPRHCHPDARDPVMKPSSSCFFITTAKEFRQMSTNLVQDIFRNRNILVLDVDPNQDWFFSEECLNRLGPIDQERQMQGNI